LTGGENMYLKRNQIAEPFVFWLIQELFSGTENDSEELEPISNREFYAWLGLITGALLVYAAIFRLPAA